MGSRALDRAPYAVRGSRLRLVAFLLGVAALAGLEAVLPAVVAAGMPFFAVAPAGPITAGQPFQVSVTATDGSYAGAHCLSFSGPVAIGAYAPIYPPQVPSPTDSEVTFTGGAATFDVTLFKAESTAISVTDETSNTGSSDPFDVDDAGIASLDAANPGAQVAAHRSPSRSMPRTPTATRSTARTA